MLVVSMAMSVSNNYTNASTIDTIVGCKSAIPAYVVPVPIPLVLTVFLCQSLVTIAEHLSNVRHA